VTDESARRNDHSGKLGQSGDADRRGFAKLLRDHKISALPVVGETGIPIGMVSEGDLIGRDDADREARLDWWLTLLAEGETLNPDFVASLRAPERRARDVMTAPVVTVGEETELREVARLLTAHRIKRVPVLREGRIVGIVSRADLVRALAEAPAEATTTATAPKGLLASAVAGIEHGFLHHRREAEPEPTGPAGKVRKRDETGLIAADFRQLVADHESQEVLHREEQRCATAQQRRRQLAELIDHHISSESWRSLMHQARQAAERGEKGSHAAAFPEPPVQRWRPRD
jgi:CBS domain-containing protein